MRHATQPVPDPRCHTPRSDAVRFVLALGLLIGLAGCGRGTAAAPEPVGPRPLGGPAAVGLPPATPRPVPAPTAAPRSAPSGPDAGNDDLGATMEAPSSPTTAVSALLARYDRALTALWAEPAAVDPTHPTHAAWLATLVPGSRLAADVATDLRTEVVDNGMVIVPPAPGATSWVHHVGSVATAADGSLSFTWCGWGPGIGRSTIDGSVLDDAVAAASGIGVARTVGDRLLLDALDELERRVLPPGTPDTCPRTGAGR
jgi:hypothetical protein